MSSASPDLPDMIRAYLKRYAKTARTAKPDTEETQP